MISQASAYQKQEYFKNQRWSPAHFIVPPMTSKDILHCGIGNFLGKLTDLINKKLPRSSFACFDKLILPCLRFVWDAQWGKFTGITYLVNCNYSYAWLNRTYRKISWTYMEIRKIRAIRNTTSCLVHLSSLFYTNLKICSYKAQL